MPEAELGGWESTVERADAAQRTLRIALVGKYVQLEDAYLSVSESLRHAGFQHGFKVESTGSTPRRCPTTTRRRAASPAPTASSCPAASAAGGSRARSARSASPASGGSRSSGICLGMQLAVCEFARHVADMEGANSTEFDPETPHPVIDLLPEQKEVSDLGGTMRLGADPIKLHADTRARELYDEAVIYERHRHRYEVNLFLRKRLEAAGLRVSGTSPDERLVEVIELDDHPFFVASQYHPEFKSRPERPAPLFREFVGAALARARERAPASAPTRRRRTRAAAVRARVRPQRCAPRRRRSAAG